MISTVCSIIIIENVIMSIDRTTWLDAQREERKFHVMRRDEGIRHYKDTYRQYFKFLGIDNDLKGKEVAEVGPADFPALMTCYNRENSFIVEPMPSEILQTFNIFVFQELAEDVDFSECDEVWLFNVLQHVVNPALIVENVKQAKVVRFFEPINYGVDECHLHNLTLDMFYDWFGDKVQYYEKNNKAVNFHQWECAYGVWER